MRFRNEHELEAVSRLLENQDFRVFLESLGQYTEQLNEALIMRELDSVALYQLRGETRCATAILRAVVESRQQLENIRSHKEPEL